MREKVYIVCICVCVCEREREREREGEKDYEVRQSIVCCKVTKLMERLFFIESQRRREKHLHETITEKSINTMFLFFTLNIFTVAIFQLVAIKKKKKKN